MEKIYFPDQSEKIQSRPELGEKYKFVDRLESNLSGSWMIFLPLAILAILGTSMLERTFSVPIYFVLFLVIGLLFDQLVRKEARRKAYFLFISIYTINVLLVIFFFYSFHVEYDNAYLAAGTDDMYYDYCARHAANHLRLSGDFDIPPVFITEEPRLNPERFQYYREYIAILAGLYYISDAITGDMHTLNPRLLNSLAIGLLAVLVFLLGLGGGLTASQAFVAGFLAGVYPSQAFWGAVIVRDTLVVLFVVGAAYSFCQLMLHKESSKSIWFILTVFWIVLTALMRLPTALLVTGLMFMYVLYQFFIKVNWILKVFLIGLCGVGLAISYSMLIIFYDAFNILVEFHTQYRMQFAAGLSSYIFGIPLIPLGAIIRPIYGLISPFPSFVPSAQRIFEDIGTLGVFLMLPFLGIGFWRSLFDKEKMIWAIFMAGFLLLISWTTFQERHFLAYKPFMFLLVVFGVSVSKNPMRLLIWEILLGIALALLYLILKVYTA